LGLYGGGGEHAIGMWEVWMVTFESRLEGGE
jgi:hypothetical protein